MTFDQPTPPDEPNTPYVLIGAEDYRWTIEAFDLLQAQVLTAAIEHRGTQRLVSASGQCPRCAHDVAFEHVGKIQAPAAVRGLGPTHVDAEVWETAEVRCSCHHPHPGRPETITTGCGIAFHVDVRPSVTP